MVYYYFSKTKQIFCMCEFTSPVEAISQRSTGSASLSRGQENIGAWMEDKRTNERRICFDKKQQHLMMCNYLLVQKAENIVFLF